MRTRRASSNRKQQQNGGIVWARWVRGALLVLSGVVLATATHLVMDQGRQGENQDRGASAKNFHGKTTNRWGHLEITSIWLERPLEYFEFEPPSPASNFWFFGQFTPARLEEFLRACPMPPELLQSLLDTNHWRAAPQGVVVEPSLAVLRDLPPEARAKIYEVLEDFPQNAAHSFPYATRSDFDEWFAQTDLSAGTLQLVERMMYRRQNMLCFADRSALPKLLPPADYLNVSRTLARVPSLLVQLRIHHESDVNQLMRYWGLPARQLQARPLLESIKRLPQGGSMNIAWFFPPVPRVLLYSYPHPTNTIAGRWPDCFWSSYNFLKEKADDRLIDARIQEQVLRSEYLRVPRADLFGDLLLLYEPMGEDIRTVHMCVYVAEDMVFTKNGYAPREPWVLMRIQDMMVHYSPKKPLSRMVFRHRSRIPSP